MVYEFPNSEDRGVLQTALGTFLQSRNGQARHVMCQVMRRVLDKYGVSKMVVNDWVVRAAGKDFALVEGTKWIGALQRECPGCGRPIYGTEAEVAILSIQEGDVWHNVTYGCSCGAVFKKAESAE